MHIRTLAIAAALPLLAATACTTSRSERGTSTQASTATTPSSQERTARTDASSNAQTDRATANPHQGSTPATGSDSTAAGGMAAEGTASGSTSQGSMGSPSYGSSGAYGSSDTGTSSGSTGSPMMKRGPAIKGHSDDQIVSGRLAKVSKDSLDIESPQGETKTLQLVPQTSVKVDGQDAQQSDLQEGQEVRASFSTVEGKDVAVEVRTGQHMGGMHDSMHQGGSMHQGDSMHQGSGSSSSTDTGAPQAEPSPQGSSSGRSY